MWLLLGIVAPALGTLAIDRFVPIPEGSDILMTQREAVNGAWDLPKNVTMEAFVARHPEWAAYAAAVAWLTPPALLERAFERLANTDLEAHLAYEARVRAFHADLRAFYYDKLFPDRPYDAALLRDIPRYPSLPLRDDAANG